jgi:C4-dicarboxylate-specific signal transduction histidine kinase
MMLQRIISSPLKQLIEATTLIAQGDFYNTYKDLDFGVGGDLGQLAKSFNLMAHSICLRDQNIESHARSLVELVEQKTRELDEQKLITLQASKMSVLGEMAGGIAHEINTPLATVKLLIAQIQFELEDVIPDLEKLSSHLKKIEDTADRMAKIVQGLKTFARDGSLDPMESVSAGLIVEETVTLCAEKIKIHNIELKVVCSTAALTVCCRTVQICQVLLNLISNAHDAIVDLDLKWIEISVEENTNWIEFKVTDSGKGISKENLEKVFQPFFTTKEIGKGTGLGLSISLGIVKSHHGQLFVDNQCPNTCFVLRLPKININL